MARFVDGASAVVNCAGPFASTAVCLAAAAIEGNAHYIDTTGEPPVAEDLVARFDSAARRRELVLAPAMGFFGALPDILATAAAGDWPKVDDVIVAYTLTGWKMTKGSQRAAAALAGARHVYRDGAMEVQRGQPSFCSWSFPAPTNQAAVMVGYPAPEVIMLPRHLATRNVRVLMTMSTIVEIRSGGAPEAVSDTERAGSAYCVQVEVARGSQRRTAYLTGRDIYGISASLIGEAVDRLGSGQVRAGGVVAAGELFDPLEVLGALPLSEVRLPSRTRHARR